MEATPTSDPHMFRRRTTMPDGRYFYYYTFDDPGTAAVEHTEAEAAGDDVESRDASSAPLRPSKEDRDV